jgi:hypothetical protein
MATAPRAPYVDRAVQMKEAAKILGMCLSKLRANRRIPYVLQPSSKTGGRPKRTYLLSDLYAELDSRRVDPQQMAS